MNTFHRKPRLRRHHHKIGSKMMLQRKLRNSIMILVVLVLAWFYISGDMGLLAMWRAMLHKKILEAKLEEEKNRSRSLDEIICRLQNDTFFIELYARTKLGMIRENEKVYIFVEESDSDDMSINMDFVENMTEE